MHSSEARDFSEGLELVSGLLLLAGPPLLLLAVAGLLAPWIGAFCLVGGVVCRVWASVSDAQASVLSRQEAAREFEQGRERAPDDPASSGPV